MLEFSAMDSDLRRLIQTIHDCTTRLVLVTAGAGTHALSDLLGVPGATRTLLEALVPYSEAAFDDFLGQTPPQYVAEDTACLLAGRAFTRARWLQKNQGEVLGVACTATIVTDRPKRGEHRAHIAVWRPEHLYVYALHLQKGMRDRSGEEDLVSRVLLDAVATACGITADLTIPLLEEDKLDSHVWDYAAAADRMAHGELDYFGILADGRIASPLELRPQVVLSGAFNPLHDGHLALARTASKITQQQVIFEISTLNVDKAPIASRTILGRMSQFAGRWPICASTARTFIEKARLYPGATFVVGYDTAVRIIHPRYYQDSHESMMSALAEIEQLGSGFLVAGRVDDRGQFHDLHDLPIPPRFLTLFRPIAGSQFRSDISSTELRQSGRRGSR